MKTNILNSLDSDVTWGLPRTSTTTIPTNSFDRDHNPTPTRLLTQFGWGWVGVEQDLKVW